MSARFQITKLSEFLDVDSGSLLPGDSIGSLEWNGVSWIGSGGPSNPDLDPPELTSATIQSVGNRIALTFSEAVQFGGGGNAGWVLSLSGGAVTATYLSGAGTSQLIYTLSRQVINNETGTAAYTQPGAGVRDVSANDLESLAGFAIANASSVGPPDVAAPTLLTATINTAGTQVTLAFSEAVNIGAGGSAGWALDLDGGAANATYLSGVGTSNLIYSLSRVIEDGEAGVIDYTQPGNGIEDAAGNDLASITDRDLVNNSTVTPEPTTATVRVTWDAPVGGTALDGYRVQRGTNGTDFPTSTEVSAGTTQLDVPGLLVGTTYHFRVLAFNAGGNSAPTTPESILLS